MLMVALTGGIGAGKSAVAARLAQLGAIVIDADALAREVVESGTPGFAEVRAAFGDAVVSHDHDGAVVGLDRQALGRIVFDDEAARRRLEQIIHPRVRERSAQIVAGAPADAVIVNDIPLLVEAGLAGNYDLVMVVEASQEVRLDRLARSRGMSPQEARSRMAAQATDEQRRAVADIVLVNDSTIEELHTAVDAVWRDRVLPLAAARTG